MLSADMGRGVPLNGLVRQGARDESLESLVVDLSKHGKGGRVGCWDAGRPRASAGGRGQASRLSVRRWKTPALCRRKRRRRSRRRTRSGQKPR